MKKNTHNLEKILVIIGVINMIGLAWLIASKDVNATELKETVNAPQAKVESFKNENFVYLGDSITEWYPITELYEEDTPIIKSGKAGYETKDILDNLDELVYQYNPTKVIILIGTNDLNSDATQEETIKNIKEIINKITKHRPKTKLYLQSIYPINLTNDKKINKKNIGKRTNNTIIKVNKELKKYCQEKNITYIDMYKELTDQEGNLALKYTIDGLHLSQLGYLKVTKVLSTYLTE